MRTERELRVLVTVKIMDKLNCSIDLMWVVKEISEKCNIKIFFLISGPNNKTKELKDVKTDVSANEKEEKQEIFDNKLKKWESCVRSQV